MKLKVNECVKVALFYLLIIGSLFVISLQNNNNNNTKNINAIGCISYKK